MPMPEEDRRSVVERYGERYGRFGYDSRSLGWTGEKQLVRFGVLTSGFDLRGRTVLDLGCGFGDLNRVLAEQYGDDYRYVGVDLVPQFLDEGRGKYGRDGVDFIEGDLLEVEPPTPCDVVVASGIFNHQLEGMDEYDFIVAVMERALSLSKDGVAMDFLSDRVDYREDPLFYSSPERVLGIAYGLSRNVVLRNDYMPFEFSVFVYKDESFSSEDLVFERFKTGGDRR